MLVDSHCHLDRLHLEKYGGDLANALEAAGSVGVEHILCVSIHPENIQAVIAIAEKYPNITASVGVHPTESCEAKELEPLLLAYSSHPKVIAIGETGLDYYRNEEKEAQFQQQTKFRTHIGIARKIHKPLIVHTRQAQKDTLNILREEDAAQVGGVMHCFTENWEMASAALDLGFFISFSGIITFKNANEIRIVAEKVPEDRILIETDAPYLAPAPHRGKPNEPAYVRTIAECLATIRRQSFEKIAEITTRNFYKCFCTPN